MSTQNNGAQDVRRVSSTRCICMLLRTADSMRVVGRPRGRTARIDSAPSLLPSSYLALSVPDRVIVFWEGLLVGFAWLRELFRHDLVFEVADDVAGAELRRCGCASRSITPTTEVTKAYMQAQGVTVRLALNHKGRPSLKKMATMSTYKEQKNVNVYQ